jgi:hypothetical protein
MVMGRKTAVVTVFDRKALTIEAEARITDQRGRLLTRDRCQPEPHALDDTRPDDPGGQNEE